MSMLGISPYNIPPWLMSRGKVSVRLSSFFNDPTVGLGQEGVVEVIAYGLTRCPGKMICPGFYRVGLLDFWSRHPPKDLWW
jgi:hypothetical protein